MAVGVTRVPAIVVNVGDGLCHGWALSLAAYSIDITAQTSGPQFLAAPNDGCAVAIVSCQEHQDSNVTALLRNVIDGAKARGLGIVLIVKDQVDTALPWLTAGVDSLACCTQSVPNLAVAILTAHNTAVMRKALNARAEDAERKLEQSRVIQHAKSIIAQKTGIKENEALQRLRKESRNQRRPMWELAKIVIEADKIIASSLKGDGVAAPLNSMQSNNGDSLPQGLVNGEDGSGVD
jgi:hypothetical protein